MKWKIPETKNSCGLNHAPLRLKSRAIRRAASRPLPSISLLRVLPALLPVTRNHSACVRGTLSFLGNGPEVQD